MTDSESHDRLEDDWVEDGEAELIVCPQCAHPNLVFRTHCRKCGGRLVGTANLIPGAELVEWSPTDGPRGRNHSTAPLRVLVMLAGVVGLTMAGFAVQAGSSVGIVVALTPVVVAVIIYSRLRNIEAERLTSDDAPPADSAACPECGEPIDDYDDICPACGGFTAL